MVMSKSEKCLDNVQNYANTENALDVENGLTAVYTYDLCVESKVLKTFDMTNVPPLDSIDEITVTVQELLNNTSVTVNATSIAELDLSAFPLQSTIRIDYTITTVDGLTNTAPAVFFDPTEDCETRGVSDPNRKPLRLKTTEGGVFGCVLCYEEDFESSTTWTVNHNLGVERPASLELYNAADARMFTGITVIDANSFSITFGSAKAGKLKALFIKP